MDGRPGKNRMPGYFTRQPIDSLPRSGYTVDQIPRDDDQTSCIFTMRGRRFCPSWNQRNLEGPGREDADEARETTSAPAAAYPPPQVLLCMTSGTGETHQQIQSFIGNNYVLLATLFLKAVAPQLLPTFGLKNEFLTNM